MTACGMKQTFTITVLQTSKTAPSFHWCCVAMEFSSQPHTICHPLFTLCFCCCSPSLCSSSLFPFLLPLLPFSLSHSITLPPALSASLSFLYVFRSHLRPLSLSHPLFLVPAYDVVLHAFSICFMPPYFQRLPYPCKNTSVDTLCTWI